MNAFAYLPTLAWCLLILTGSAWLGYSLLVQALDGWVAKPGRSWECVDGCAWCEDDLYDVRRCA